MSEPREDEKLSPVGERNGPEICRVLARADRGTILETLLRENTSLGTVDPELNRSVWPTAVHPPKYNHYSIVLF